MNIGVVYNIKGNYIFEEMDLSLNDFIVMRDITFLKYTLELFGHNVNLIKGTNKSDISLQVNAKYDYILYV